MTKKHAPQTPNPTASGDPSQLPTFLDHIYELRRRLFWIVAVILVASGAAYPFLSQIIAFVTAPLGGQQLYYLTPVGGLSFSIKICFYIGIIVSVPIIMFHIYRYLEPIMGQRIRRSALFYVGFSTALAIAGMLFAYYVALPGALRFLTGMDLTSIQAMLTVDSYLSFVMTYLLGSAIMFQIPFLLGIINTMTPLKPGKLMGAQRYVIVGAFIAAAIISPTPDIMNQALLALPIIVMYQIGVLLVWVQNRKRSRKERKKTTVAEPVFTVQPIPKPVLPEPSIVRAQTQQVRAPRMDGFTVKQPVAKKAALAATAQTRQPVMTAKPPMRTLRVPTRSVDGFSVRRPSQQID